MKIDLTRFLSSPVFSDLDRRFATFLVRQDEGASGLLGAAAALVSYQLGRGQVFLDLSSPPAWDDPNDAPLTTWPTEAEWKRDLERSPAVGGPEETKPLILAPSGKLYLQRYWSYENRLADQLRERSVSLGKEPPEDVSGSLTASFGEADDQKQAARNAWRRPFSVISGGPGTGKTTTVLKILMLLMERDPEIFIRLVAPTGKAAARLRESIREGLENIDCPTAVRTRLMETEASTIHRLLGSIPGSVFFRHNAENPLAADVVVLDEASMVDLPLMAKLFAALPKTCRAIVLGDKDQLASVEAGSVLSGIVEASIPSSGGEARTAPLSGVATLLTRNYRFGNESAIFRLCQAVREGNPAEALSILRDQEASDAVWRELPEAAGLKEKLRPRIAAEFGEFLEKKDPGEALAALGKFQILTALRLGPYGKENINRLVEEILREEEMIPPGRRNYSGRPLMVTENDYAVRLFNGDVGVLLEDEEGKLMAWFRNEDGSSRKLSPSRLPFTETAFAMTVHKAQGSEFDHVLTILPAHDTRVLTRELIYTALSRARRGVELWGDEEIVSSAITRRVARASGLVDLLED